MYVYIYIYIYIYIRVCVIHVLYACVYIYREREKERDIHTQACLNMLYISVMFSFGVCVVIVYIICNMIISYHIIVYTHIYTQVCLHMLYISCLLSFGVCVVDVAVSERGREVSGSPRTRTSTSVKS